LSLADVQFTDRGQAVVAQVTGEVDLSNAESIRNAITDVTSNSSLAVVLDLSELDYLDSAGIQLIYQLREDLRARGQELRLVIPPGSPATDALRLAGVERHLETTAAVEDALRGLS
jgi:anti-sigma B factor antagonist